MAARAGLAPWSKGYKRLKDEDYKQGFIPGHGFLAAGYPDEWTGKGKKAKGRWLTDSTTGVKYYVTSKDIEALVRTSNSLDESGNYKYVPDTLFMQFIAEHNVSAEKGMAAYIEESFSGNGKGKIWNTDGIGHILQLEYNDYTQVMRVHFSKGAICVYFRVPMVVFGELYTLAQNKTTTKHTFDGNERGALGVRFWDLVRIRGSMHGGRFRFIYEQENGPSISDYIPSSNDVGRPRKYFLAEDTKDVPVTFNKLRKLDPDMWKEVRANAAQQARTPFLEALAKEKGKLVKPSRSNFNRITNFEVESSIFDTSDMSEAEKAELNKMYRLSYLYDEDIPSNKREGYVSWEFAKKFNRDYKFEPSEHIVYRKTPIFNSIIQPGSVADLRLKAFEKLKKAHEAQFQKENKKYYAAIEKARLKLLSDPTLIAESKRRYAEVMSDAKDYTKNFKPADTHQEAILTKKYQRKVPIGSVAEENFDLNTDYLDTMENIYGAHNMKTLKQSIKKYGYENFILNASADDGSSLFETPAVMAHAAKDKNALKKIHADLERGYSKLSTSGKNTYNKIKGSTEAETDFLREYYLASWNVLPKDYYGTENDI